MCGIGCSLLLDSVVNSGNYSWEAEHLTQLFRRGPNNSKLINIGNISFAGNVLWQQGLNSCEQPLEVGNIILLFNGDIYELNDYRSDTEWLGDNLSKCDGNDLQICDLFSKLKGPYSLIFYNKLSKDLYFARDFLGRNSMIIEFERSLFKLKISSTSYYSDSHGTQIMELPPLGLFKLNTLSPSRCTLFPWHETTLQEWNLQKQSMELNLMMNFKIDQPINNKWLQINSGQLESFDFHIICKNVNLIESNVCDQFLNDFKLQKHIDHFTKLLESSVKERVQRTPPYCQNCIRNINQSKCNHSKVAILFSGGIDCSILAMLANKFIDESDSIDLINVAFEKLKGDNYERWETPDRISGIASYNELCTIFPSRKWNFVKVNVTRDELEENLQNHIKHLIYPLTTVLDESIGCAFWFASRGRGTVQDTSYTSPARVVLIGSGCDELFGGYKRFRNAYKRYNGTESEKNANVLLELEKDFSRLPARNLARDDRVIADNGKTSRSPYLEEKLVQYVRSLKSTQRCCFLLPDGIGDKLFLRLCGYKLGLRESVFLKKRAIQFGSKIANKKENAADESKYLKFHFYND